MRPVPFKGNLIVTNLPDEITAPELANLFDDHGIVIGAVIRQIPANAGRATIGVVALAPDSAVDKAIEAVDQAMVGERKIKVGRAKPQAPRAAKPQAKKPVAIPQRSLGPQVYAAAMRDAKPERAVVVEYKTRRFVRP
jgi:hypothetical protein